MSLGIFFNAKTLGRQDAKRVAVGDL